MQETLAGQTLGRYHLQQCIGQGGMAVVYLAYDQQLQREVAVKIVHGACAEDLARFKREAEMLATLTHEHILPVYDSGQQGPWHYLVAPYIGHGTLADRLQTRGPLTPEEAGVMLDQIASALQYAHDRGILHRDIKPSNILLRDDNYAYLADFGIARLLEGGSGLTQSGFCVGTPEYMAPELCESQVSQGSDIYALGVVLYMMLTGQQPFTAPTPLATLQKHMHEHVTPPSRFNPDLSPQIERVILAALEKDPHRRFQNVRAFANAYRHALQPSIGLHTQQALAPAGFYADQTIAVRQVSSPPSAPRPGVATPVRHSRRVLFFIIPGLCVLLLIGSLVAALSLGRHATASPSLLPTATTPFFPSATASPSPDCTIDDAAGLLDQNQVCQAAQSLPYSLVVHTSRTTGGPDAGAQPSETIDAHTIVISIVLVRRHGHDQSQFKVTITGGSEVALTSEQYREAENAFSQTAQDGDYTAATIEAIHTLQQGGA
jgi:serine/threonine protein kinase